MTISPEQIQANIAATQARRQAARERDIAQREAARRHPHEAYIGKLVGFIVSTRKGYKPFIGRPIPDTYDSFINVVGSQEPQETLEQAQAFLVAERDNLALVLEKPVPGRSESVGYMHWLSDMLKAQETPLVICSSLPPDDELAAKRELMDRDVPGWRTLRHANGTPQYSPDGTMLDDQGQRSIFDDVDD